MTIPYPRDGTTLIGAALEIPVDEADFWKRLEFRISAEFAGFADRRLHFYWCDGLVPDEYALVGVERRIGGNAWCGSSGQERWRFTLVVGQDVKSHEQIDWAALLPGDRLTGWLTPDPKKKTLRIDPLSGYDEDTRRVPGR